mmetsp:Transcript_11270/g.21331  ORF Transcript_11270/g.21331 Transcript_11270/m.21331 type:complete len:240 (-) Transcript_11270:95-814(-)
MHWLLKKSCIGTFCKKRESPITGDRNCDTKIVACRALPVSAAGTVQNKRGCVQTDANVQPCELMTIHEECTEDEHHVFNNATMFGCTTSECSIYDTHHKPRTLMSSTTTEQPNSTVYSLKLTKVKCKECYNHGHVPILHVYVHASKDQSQQLSEIAGSKRGTYISPDKHKHDSMSLRCCVCGAKIPSDQANTTRSHLEARAMLFAGLLQPRASSRASKVERDKYHIETQSHNQIQRYTQ